MVVVIGQCRWVKWDVSGDFLMGFVGAWLPRGKGRQRKRKRKRERNNKKKNKKEYLNKVTKEIEFEMLDVL